MIRRTQTYDCGGLQAASTGALRTCVLSERRLPQLCSVRCVTCNRYIPCRPAKRSLVSILIFLLCLAHIMGKTTAMALLYATNYVYLVSYICVDMALYLLFKIVRRDFYCWVPRSGIFLSLIYRICTKVMADLTGLPQLRCPLDLGGACWAVTMATTQVACLVSSSIYCRAFKGDAKLECASLMGAMGALSGIWVLAIVGLAFTMERKYLYTLVSLTTASQYVEAIFVDALNKGDDEVAFRIFTYNEKLWTQIRPDVQRWMQQNVDRIADEKPEWLTPGVVRSISPGFLPEDLLRLLGTSARTSSTSASAQGKPQLSRQNRIRAGLGSTPSVFQRLESEALATNREGTRQGH